jgi:hypothetical protein
VSGWMDAAIGGNWLRRGCVRGQSSPLLPQSESYVARVHPRTHRQRCRHASRSSASSLCVMCVRDLKGDGGKGVRESAQDTSIPIAHSLIPSFFNSFFFLKKKIKNKNPTCSRGISPPPSGPPLKRGRRRPARRPILLGTTTDGAARFPGLGGSRLCFCVCVCVVV